VTQIMTPQERLVTVREGASLEEARELLRVHRLERVLVLNDAGELCGLITVKDMMKSTEHPFAAKDEQGRLRVAAAIGVGAGTEERTERLAEAGVDMIVVDTA
ncbi:MAG TPA: IMP dehydrogenase, partial [Thauera sp.]|nr:IMP dehydrogenase [Thauera sp.]